MEIRQTSDDDLQAFVETFHSALGRFPEAPADATGVWWAAIEADRGLLATRDGRPIGTATTYPFELTLPGNVVVSAPGVTCVGVLPTHRRQGMLTVMMRRQLADLRERGEFLSVLLASEATIYGRFGYGTATYSHRLTVQRHQSAFRANTTDTGSIELRKRLDSTELLEEIYDRYRRTQPGALSRPHRWWERGAGQPPIAPADRHVAVHRSGTGIPDGYATYAVDNGTLTVDEIITGDDAVFSALARFALDHDLVTQVVFKHVPFEHPLRWQFADFNAGQTGPHMEWLWVRLLDVPRALKTRSWFTDGELVLDVDDPFLNEHNRYLLTITNGHADCVPTDREPDLSLDVRDLGAIYLGGTTPSVLVRAGHIKAHNGNAAARADAIFRGERPPHCLHWF